MRADHTEMNMIKDLNFILSAIVPESKRGVIHANIIWNLTNRTPGIVIPSRGSSHGIPFTNA